MQVVPYLGFSGQCKAAFECYQQCLRGQIVAMFTYGETPAAEHSPAEMQDRIMHARLVAGGETAIEDGAPVYLCWPEEFVGEVERAGLSVERLFGCSGLGAHLQEDHLLALMADPARWPAWREMLLRTCDHPMIVGVSTLLLAVARRQ